MKTNFFTTKLKLQFLMIVGLLFTACSCVKEDLQDELPPITQTGENTFGCIIDGEVLIPKDGKATGPPGSSPYIGLIAHLHDNYFKIRVANAWDDGGDYIYIYIYNLTKEGVYHLGNGKDAYDVVYDQPINPNPKYHFSSILKSDKGKPVGRIFDSYENSGTVTITRFDAENKIYSGTFQFKAVNRDDPNDIIEVSHGRFDLDR